MHSKWLLTLGTATWLILANTAFAEEFNTGGSDAVDTKTTSEAADGAADATDGGGFSTRGGGNVEHRRNDHSGPSGRASSSYGGDSGRGPSGGGESGGENGGSDGGDVD
ncbi:hypothetical protein [Dongia sp. agr-C8]